MAPVVWARNLLIPSSCNDMDVALCLHPLHLSSEPPSALPTKSSQGQSMALHGWPNDVAVDAWERSNFETPKGSPTRGPAQAANSEKLTTPLPSSSKLFQASSVSGGMKSPHIWVMIMNAPSSSFRESFPEPSASAQSKSTFNERGSGSIFSAAQHSM
eukprot:CAMPEP_0170635220 /NCGR_PEP_ID=MMETSP0224-20130122/37088_1 /TAXON_ID=285029 /ORGANISM="Togula jolla, Strain CCCM 725" /LENGTH=157 /DNA_ID=CAMNT_0010964671 /DNA_START=797 /DNA_END=1271 /DNA_ORIENTATION=-